ncbi:Hypothetical protein GSB_155268, partial [Giardia duodenalis]
VFRTAHQAAEHPRARGRPCAGGTLEQCRRFRKGRHPGPARQHHGGAGCDGQQDVKLNTHDLVSAEGSVLLTSALKIRKFTYGFNNDQVRAYVELLSVHDIAVTKNDNGDTSYTVPLLAYMVSEKYLPLVNPFLAEPGICLMNGNFIDHATVSTVCLCGEDRVLFASDIERNRYFA